MKNSCKLALVDISKVIPTKENNGNGTWFNPQEFLGKRGFKYFSQSCQYWLAACSLIQDLDNYDKDDEGESIGIAVGTNYGAVKTLTNFHRVIIEHGYQSLSPMSAPNFCINSIASQASIRYKLHRFNTTLTTPYVSGIDTIFTAAQEIKAKRVSSVLAGAAEEIATESVAEKTYREGAVAALLTRCSKSQKHVAKLSGFIQDFIPTFCTDSQGFNAHAYRLKNKIMQSKDYSLLCNDFDLVVVGDEQHSIQWVTELLSACDIHGNTIRVAQYSEQHGAIEPLISLIECIKTPSVKLQVTISKTGQLRIFIIEPNVEEKNK